MATFSIQDEDLAVLKGKVIVITGESGDPRMFAYFVLIAVSRRLVRDWTCDYEAPPVPGCGSNQW